MEASRNIARAGLGESREQGVAHVILSAGVKGGNRRPNLLQMPAPIRQPLSPDQFAAWKAQKDSEKEEVSSIL